LEVCRACIPGPWGIGWRPLTKEAATSLGTQVIWRAWFGSSTKWKQTSETHHHCTSYSFRLSGTLAFVQAGGNTAGGSSAAGGPAASKTTTGDSMNGGTTGGGGTAMKNGGTGATTGSSMPSAKDASTQGVPGRPAQQKRRATTLHRAGR